MILFHSSATLRDNLDPFKSHNDAKLWDALKKARLSDVVRHKLSPHDPYIGGRGLDAMIDHETTFSAGKNIFGISQKRAKKFYLIFDCAKIPNPNLTFQGNVNYSALLEPFFHRQPLFVLMKLLPMLIWKPTDWFKMS